PPHRSAYAPSPAIRGSHVSMLKRGGITDWIASDADEYVEIAVRLAEDAQRLTALRTELRGRIVASPLCNGQRMARQMERLFRAVWRRWCAQRLQNGG
ncbi:O-linked N-acetylglucosamine transferase family protein, partial [Azospirillum isscasi]|nr:hypothetical protein [Azospirillum isscasi]